MAMIEDDDRSAAEKIDHPVDNPYQAYLIVLFVVGILVLNYPLLSLYDRIWLPLGIPLLYLYLFLTWLGIIVLTALVMERTSKQRSRPPTRR